MTHKVPVQSLIDHIKTAIDVDPWAKEMVENLLKEKKQTFFVDENGKITPLPVVVRCKDCQHKEESVSPSWEAWCNRLHCGCDLDWFCAEGRKR